MSVRLYSNVEVAETGDPPAVHDVLGADHTVTGGAALDLVGQSAANVLARVTPSASPGAAAKVLASAADGLLTLLKLIVTNHVRAGGGLYLGKTDTDPARGEIRTSDATITTGVLVAKPTGFGYSKNNYRVLQVGSADPARMESVSLGYDPAANTSGAFTGDGSEILLRRGAAFFTPNAADNAFFPNCLRFKDGMLGIGTGLDPSADGRTHVRTFGVYAGSMIWECWSLTGTSQTIIADSAQDVTAACAIQYVVKPSSGAAVAGATTLANGASTTLYNVGSDVVTLTVAANGSVTIARTGGTLTYKVIVQLLWL